jgi:hypothetical protein
MFIIQKSQKEKGTRRRVQGTFRKGTAEFADLYANNVPKEKGRTRSCDVEVCRDLAAESAEYG